MKTYLFNTKDAIGGIEAESEEAAVQGIVKEGHTEFELFVSVGKYERKVEVIKVEDK